MEQDGLFYCKCHPDINKDYPSFFFEINEKDEEVLKHLKNVDLKLS